MDAAIVWMLLVGLPLACASAASRAQWETFRFGDLLEFSAPSELQETGGQGIDSKTATWRSADLEMLIDFGRFADPLGGHANRPGFTAEEVSISGLRALVVAYDAADGRRVVAAHFPDLAPVDRAPETLTISIHARNAEAAEAARRIIDSVSFSS